MQNTLKQSSLMAMMNSDLDKWSLTDANSFS